MSLCPHSSLNGMAILLLDTAAVIFPPIKIKAILPRPEPQQGMQCCVEFSLLNGSTWIS
jgi:hypothetical protein